MKRMVRRARRRRAKLAAGKGALFAGRYRDVELSERIGVLSVRTNSHAVGSPQSLTI